MKVSPRLKYKSEIVLARGIEDYLYSMGSTTEVYSEFAHSTGAMTVIHNHVICLT